MTDNAARKAVLLQYAEAYDRFAEQEQIAVLEGDYAKAEVAHVNALVTLRAYNNEDANPLPAGLVERRESRS